MAAAAEEKPKKGPKFNIADSNIAYLGTPLERSIKEASADGEPAWKDAGKKVGLQVWRVEQFKIKEVKQNIGQFYTGDSYILLNTYKKADSDALLYDLHFWLGSETSQDEAGVAAYKTVELDTLLQDKPVQYRECQGYESEKFLSYFASGIRYLDGGVESGFNHVKPEEYKPRLLWIKGGKKSLRIVEVAKECSSLNSGDCFILDNGLKLYQWIGKGAGIFEKNKSAQICAAIDSERDGKAAIITVNEGDQDSADFLSFLSGTSADIKSADAGGPDAQVTAQSSQKRLMRFSDASGAEQLTEVPVKKSSLSSQDVFILDTGAQVFTWIGSQTSAKEKQMALSYAQIYLTKFGRPNWLPISKIVEGGDNVLFNTSLSD